MAGAILIPRDYLILEEVVLEKKTKIEWSDKEIEGLADKYRASREVVIRRLLICNRITAEFYRSKMKQYEQEYAKLRKIRKDREGWFLLPHYATINEAGLPFIRLVLDSYYHKKITASDLSDFLNIKWKHVSRIEQAV